MPIWTETARPITILLADDCEDDRLLTRAALQESRLLNDLREVEDGEELMDYLLCRDQYAVPGSAPRPGIILLDWHMPRKSGREALHEIKTHPVLRRIPIIMLTTSGERADIVQSYDLGVNSFITKPVSFEDLVEVMKQVGKYWIEIVTRPAMTDENI